MQIERDRPSNGQRDPKWGTDPREPIPPPLETFLDSGDTLPRDAGVIVAVFYLIVVVLGILSMGFQLLGSRLLNPHFGSSIIVWSWLI